MAYPALVGYVGKFSRWHWTMEPWVVWLKNPLTSVTFVSLVLVVLFLLQCCFSGLTLCLMSTFVFTICHLSSHACVIFVSIVFDLCRWKVHSPRDPRRQKTVGRPSARQVVFVFTCVLDGSSTRQVSRPCFVQVRSYRPQIRTRGECVTGFWLTCARGSAPEESSDPGKDGEQTNWSAQGLWLA